MYKHQTGLPVFFFAALFIFFTATIHAQSALSKIVLNDNKQIISLVTAGQAIPLQQPVALLGYTINKQQYTIDAGS
ncbi:MAG: hypothetical protein ABIU77_13480, partial [Ferruginibacter sp.]